MELTRDALTQNDRLRHSTGPHLRSAFVASIAPFSPPLVRAGCGRATGPADIGRLPAAEAIGIPRGANKFKSPATGPPRHWAAPVAGAEGRVGEVVAGQEISEMSLVRATVILAAFVALLRLAVAEDGSVLPGYPASVLPAVPDNAAGDVEWGEEMPAYVPSAGNMAQRAWFRQARLGLFIHWGIYANLGRGEWVLHNDQLHLDDYRQLAPRFNPVFFNATEWVLMAKDAGMRYITITAKHHDGFCLWHTKQTTWNVIDATPYPTDIIKSLAAACREHGLKLGLYYSPLDWSHTDYYPRGFTGTMTGRPDAGDWSAYLAYMNRQLQELVTEYGSDLLAIWLDGWWDLPSNERWQTHQTYQLIHRLNSSVLVGNNHHRTPFWGEDIQIFEKDAPGENSKGFAHASLQVEDRLPLETCDTLHQNGAWGYTADHTPRPIADIVKLVARTAGFDANLLLNLGPPPDGMWQLEMQETLQQLGGWMRMFGHTIYDTRGGPVGPQAWGVCTHRGADLWLHVLDWPEDLATLDIALPGLAPHDVVEGVAEVETCREPLCRPAAGDVAFLPDAGGGVVELQLSANVRDDYDTIVRLSLTQRGRSKTMREKGEL